MKRTQSIIVQFFVIFASCWPWRRIARCQGWFHWTKLFARQTMRRMRCKVVDSHHCWSLRDRGNTIRVLLATFGFGRRWRKLFSLLYDKIKGEEKEVKVNGVIFRRVDFSWTNRRVRFTENTLKRAIRLRQLRFSVKAYRVFFETFKDR